MREADEKAMEAAENDPNTEGKPVSGVHMSVSTSLVQFHGLVHKVMEYLAKNMYRSTFVTPRHYLDLINHFVKLFDEKRLQLEDQQKHLATGLRALKETEEEVARRQVELDAKQKELAEQQQKANETLKQMMESEKDAQKKRTEAIRVSGEVEVEMKSISERSAVVEGELAEAKPALEAAKKAVSGISKRQLDEIRAFKKPPILVEITMMAVCVLMGKKVKDWKAVKGVIADAKFVPNILDFDSKKITEKRRAAINKKYMSNEDWTFEKVNKSSKACGPLVQWVHSQVKFAHLLDSVEPMQKEIRDLKATLKTKQEQAENLQKMVAELEAKIEEYKQVYETMVQKITELKNEMKIVQDTMARAVKLLADLSDEKNRWQGETDNFQKQISTLVGDCLISAGFLTYIGYYNITYRQILVSKWKEILAANGLPYNENMELSVYLSAPAQRIAWKAAQLPEDDLCVENAIILERFNRYPLVVDPSGQATTFLMNNYKSKKIVRTSFLDSAFLKNLESGLRFGNALLIEDVENMDPILNPVLNKEYQTVGGRKLIRLANKDIDFSPLFTMFLVTRDPLSAFAPDLCSRVTFVNFSVTPSSLQSQCLSKILRSEAPDIDKKRNDQLRLQGEFKFQLRELEDKLLNALNSVSGNILDDTKLMGTLETLKLKAKVIAEKAAETEKVLDQIEEASQFYTPFARATSKLYFSLENLANVHFLYQFSLKAFLEIVEYILHTATLPELQALEDASHRESRLVPLVKALHRVTFIRTKRALLVKDHSAFALRVAQVFLECHPDDEFNIKEEVLSYVLKGRGYQDGKEVSQNLATKLELTSMGAQLLGNLYKLSGFESLENEVSMSQDDWADYRGGDAEAPIPNNWETGEAQLPHQKTLEKLAIQKIFRPDQMIRSARNFVEQVFGWNLYEFEANADSLTTVVQEQINEETPILMASTPGNDPSAKIEQCASEVFGKQMKSKFAAFAMGSPEDYQKADDAITAACKRGTWVCLKNVHLSPGWLTTLEKRLHRLKKDSSFRLFMTMEIHPKIPVTLLRKSQIVIYEPPLGIKASLQRTFNTVNADRVDRAPEERSRLYILLGWLHAVVLERLRFEPIGWSKAYEFSETDLVCAMAALDEWIDKLAQNRDNVDPNEIPWDALHKMLVQFVYGGRVDNKYDTARLTSFVENLMTTEAFNTKFALAARCVECNEPDPNVGRLGFVYPVVDGSKVNREMLARVVQVPESGDLKIVFLKKYIVVGKRRINLNAQDNWIKRDAFRISNIRMEPAIELPEKTKFVNIKEWALNVDDVKCSNPAIIGLPPRAELMILAKRAVEMCSQLLKLQDIETGNAMEELTAVLDNADGADAGGAVPSWMKALRTQAEKWAEDIPDGMEKLKEKQDSIKNPLFRFMRREFQLGGKILKRMNNGLRDLCAFVDGDIKATNDLRQLINMLAKEQIPKAWGLYDIDRNLGVSHWILDFVKRITQFNMIATEDYVSSPKPCLWLGGLFQPEGFIAATRQYIAQINKWPLEALKLYLEIGEAEPVKNSFVFEGLILYGAGWSKESGCLMLTEKTQTPLPESRFIWINGEEEKDANNYEGQAPDIVSVRVPVYLNSSFKSLLFDIYCRVSSSLPPEMWVQRAVSLSVWSN